MEKVLEYLFLGIYAVLLFRAGMYINKKKEKIIAVTFIIFTCVFLRQIPFMVFDVSTRGYEWIPFVLVAGVFLIFRFLYVFGSWVIQWLKVLKEMWEVVSEEEAIG